MKKHTLFLIVFVAVAIQTKAQYSNATLNGAWFLYQTPLTPYSDSLLYLVFDGNGTITDCSGFGTFTGSNYSVNPSGVITGSLIMVGEGILQFSGQLSSQNGGTLTVKGINCVLSKISNPGALTGTFTGTLSTANCGQKTVMITVNNQGIITAASGLGGLISGRIFADLGVFMGHLKTGDLSNGWNELSIMGYYSNNTLNGKVAIDLSDCTSATARLTKGTSYLTTQSAYFDGAGDRIRILDESPINTAANPSAYQITGKSITVEAWIYPMKLPGKQDGTLIFNRPYSEKPWMSFELSLDNYAGDEDDPRIQWMISDGTLPGNWGYALDPNKPIVGGWTHVAGTYDGSKVSLYINGNLVDQSNYTSNIGAGEIGFYIGGYLSGYFKGLIDEVRLWNVVRSQSQIQSFMNQQLTGNEAGLAGYWPLDAVYTTSAGLKAVADKTANHNDLLVQYDANLVANPWGVQPLFPISTFTHSDWYAVTGTRFGSLLNINGWPTPTINMLTKPTGMVLKGDTLFWTPQAYQSKWNEVHMQANNNSSSRNKRFWVYVDQLTRAQNQLSLDVSYTGNLGGMGMYGKGLYYKSLNGLYSANFSLVDRLTQKFAGCLYNYGDSAFVPTDVITPVSSRFPGFTAFRNTLVDSNEKNRMGVQVVQTIHSSTATNDDKYVILEYQVTNQSGTTIPELFAQLTADFDIGDYSKNLGGYDPALKFSYLYESGGATNPYYYGFALLNNPVSGASIFQNGIDTAYIRSIDKLTIIEPNPTTPAEYRSQLNTGPYPLANGATRTFAFAIMAGDELNDIKYSVTRAATVFNTYTALDEVVADNNKGLTLSKNYPNPFKDETKISYSVAHAGIVSLKVYDLQGKEIEVVFNKFVNSGPHTATIKANNLPSGTYIYKLESEGSVVAKKFVIMK